MTTANSNQLPVYKNTTSAVFHIEHPNHNSDYLQVSVSKQTKVWTFEVVSFDDEVNANVHIPVTRHEAEEAGWKIPTVLFS